MRATLNTKRNTDAVVTPRALERRALHEFDDGRLVLEHLAGDPQAFGTLVDRYQTRLLNFINRTIGDRERAEDLLHEVLRPFPVSNGPIDEVEQPGLVAVHQGAEGLVVAREVLKHQPAIVQLVQRLALEGARRHDYLAIPLEGCWHGALPVRACTSSPT